MKCSGCGHRVPFWGGSCPYCGEDKSEAQSVRILALTGLLAMSGLGYSFWGIGGFLICCLAGLGVGFVAEKILSPHQE